MSIDVVVVDVANRERGNGLMDETRHGQMQNGNHCGHYHVDVDVDVEVDDDVDMERLTSSRNGDDVDEVDEGKDEKDEALQSPKKKVKRQMLHEMQGISNVRSRNAVSATMDIYQRIRKLLQRRKLAMSLWSRRGIVKLPPLTCVPSTRERQYVLFAQMRQVFAVKRSHRRRARMFRNRSLAVGSSQFHDQQGKLNGGTMNMGLDSMMANDNGGESGWVHYYKHHESDNNNNSTPSRDILAAKTQLFRPEEVDESIFDLALQFLLEKNKQRQQQQQFNGAGVASQM